MAGLTISLIPAVSNLGKALGLVAAGQLTFGELAGMNATELAAFLKTADSSYSTLAGMESRLESLTNKQKEWYDSMATPSQRISMAMDPTYKPQTPYDEAVESLLILINTEKAYQAALAINTARNEEASAAQEAAAKAAQEASEKKILAAQAAARELERVQKATIKLEIDTTDFVKAYNKIEAVKQSASEMAGKIEKGYGKGLADAYIESVVSAYRDGISEVQRASQAQKDIWSDYNEDYQILLIGEEEFKRQQYIKGLDLYLRIEQEKTGATAEEMAKRRALILEDYDKSGDDIDNLADTGKTAMETLTDAVNNFGAQSSQVITDFALHGKASFSDMIDSMIEDLVRMMIQEQIMGPLFKGISGVLFGSATGNAFEGGNVIPFASGGVVTRPTVFPMAQGAGLMGEAGPEAILPLKRVASGNLGVEASGGGMQMQVTIYNSTGDSVETKQGKTADGSPTLDVMIDQAVAKNLGKFGSQSNKSMRQNFGASQRLTRR